MLKIVQRKMQSLANAWQEHDDERLKIWQQIGLFSDSLSQLFCLVVVVEAVSLSNRRAFASV